MPLLWLGIALAATAGCGDAPHPAAQLEVWHAFSGGDGAWARGSLSSDGRALYGRTSLGGAHDSGTIFRIGGAGSGLRVLHSFTAGGDNGAGNQPHHNAMLVRDAELVGAALYGGSTAEQDGAIGLPASPEYPKTGNGTLFTIRTDGSSYAVLLELGGRGAPALPHSPPTLSPDGAALYGMTSNGGAHDKGTIYSLAAAGGAATVLHSFDKPDGEEPHGLLVFDSSRQTLLGMTRKGGTLPAGAAPGEPSGVVFRFEPRTGHYDPVHTFATGDPENGATNDHGFLTLVDGTAYATTELGGQYGSGTIFAIEEDGSGFRVVHSFAGGTGDGALPYGSLVPVGGWLYGTTTRGGTGDDGTLFRFLPPDGPVEILASFDRATSGAFPEDNVIPSPDGQWLVGMTQAGGEHDPAAALYYGTVFAFPIPRD